MEMDCGRGYQYQAVQCMDGNDVVVPLSYCGEDAGKGAFLEILELVTTNGLALLQAYRQAAQSTLEINSHRMWLLTCKEIM